MKALKQLSLLLVSALALAACGKKDSNFVGQAMGARAKNAAAIAQAQANAGGTSIDIIDIHTVSVSPMTLSATVMVNGQSKALTTTLYSVNTPVQGATVIGNFNVQVAAVCATADCNPYYIVATASNIQIGYKFYRLEATAARDNYQIFSPVQGFDDVVNYLNMNGDASM